MSCGVGCRRGLDPALLWLWRRPVATAPIQPLAWEPPYAAGAAQEIATTLTPTKDKKTKKQKKQRGRGVVFFCFGWGFFGWCVFFCFFFFLSFVVVVIVVVVAISWAAPAAYGGSQARG